MCAVCQVAPVHDVLGEYSDMAWIVRKHSKGTIDTAGDVLISPESDADDIDEALEIVCRQLRLPVNGGH